MNPKEQALTLSPYLAAYLDRRDRALGFVRPSFLTRQAASYLYAIEKARQDLIEQSFKVGLLKGIRKRQKAIMRESKKATGEKLRQLTTEYEQLYKQALRIEANG